MNVKIVALLMIAAATGLAAVPVVFYKTDLSSPKKTSEKIREGKTNETLRLKQYAAQIKPFLKSNDYDTNHCFFVDVKIHSGNKRFFVYDLNGDSVCSSGMVTHGSGSLKTDGTIKFSNEPKSLATSIGKYRIGNAYFGKFGLAYKLHGLDKTNSNAFIRAVVLHAHPAVPFDETYPQHICTSWGCPTVNPEYLQVLKNYIDKTDRSILLYIFY
jgi:hypothetical protein